MKLQVNARNGRKIADLEVTESTRVEDLKNLFARKYPKYYPTRQRFTFGGVPGTPLTDGKTLADYKLGDGDIVTFKDLGAQIGYRTVFLIEYAGPLFIYAFFYFFRDLIYNNAQKHPLQEAQKIAFICWTVHYVKRELETLFVHRFSHGTMPVLPNLPRNCGHYWLAGLAIAYFVNHPLFTSPPSQRVYIGVALFIVGQIGNFITHVMLRNLRPEGSKERKIPRGFLFDFVSCPNYFFEIMVWIGFSLITQSIASFVFALMGAGQMYMWAAQKHRRYRKEFDGKEGRPLYPRNRKMMVPFLF